eukprot:CAMPEP_0185723436 /NCGR_PEP_ID=MMETSP1171-20130828/286_1 /TAXON_ID=374046 /ORGANISM="Helicotheca tamensis, Strain CCMP826" /LENGTH=191 /DNA_ID=CAMNT_0028391139 /DNA_START=58 /DNA_END=633 /DNA_ORIENTATION=-
MSEEEPAAKKAKTNGDDDEPTGWENHTCNASECLMKEDEGRNLSDFVDEEVTKLQGIGPLATQVLDALKVKTISQLATYKFFLIARALKTLAETETEGGRPEGSRMNVDKAVDKEWEKKSFTEICEAPTEALEGISQPACELLEKLRVKTIGDLAELKYCRWAEAIVTASKFENTKTAKERKVEAQLKKLS